MFYWFTLNFFRSQKMKECFTNFFLKLLIHLSFLNMKKWELLKAYACYSLAFHHPRLSVSLSSVYVYPQENLGIHTHKFKVRRHI